jgi:ABC-type glycerol-3-phosphate transport system substrate-binding protein
MKGIMRNLSGQGEAVDDKYVVGLFPKAADGNRYGIGNNHVIGVSKQSKNKEAAVKFIKFLTQNEEITKFYYGKMGAVPTYKKLLADPLYTEDTFARVVIESAEFANCVPSKQPKLSAALDLVAVAMQAAILEQDTAKALEVADESIKTTFGQ